MVKKDNFQKWMANPKPFDWKDVRYFIEKDDILSSIILAHSHIEIILQMSLNAISGNLRASSKGVNGYYPSNSKRIGNFSFSQILELSNYFNLVDDDMYLKLKKLNELRNEWVHGYLFKENLDKEMATKIALKSEEYVSEILNNLKVTLKGINPNI
jgi:hypothetical protein